MSNIKDVPWVTKFSKLWVRYGAQLGHLWRAGTSVIPKLHEIFHTFCQLQTLALFEAWEERRLTKQNHSLSPDWTDENLQASRQKQWYLLLHIPIIAEPHTLENLVTHRSEKFWLSRDCPYVRTSVRQYLENKESSTITIATSLILGVHAIVNWQLSQQAIRWPVSRYNIAGSGLELIEAACFFFKLTADQLLVCRLDRGLKSRYFSGGEGKSTRKGKISALINPWHVVDLSSDIFLVQSSLGNSLIYCIRNFYHHG